MKLGSTALGILGSRILGRRFYARVHLTYRCNYRCGMCGLRRLEGTVPELGAEALDTVAVHLAALGARHVVLTGGEAFLRPDLPEIVGSFARRGFSVRVQTNGGPQVSREALARCAEAGLRDLSVSIDSLDEPLQDRICGREGVVANALRTLALARELLPRGISQANVVASRHNFAELPRLVRAFSALGVYTYITPVMTGDPDGTFRFRSSGDGFQPEGLDPALRNSVIGELISLRRERRGLTNSTKFLRDYRDYLASGECDWRCEAGTLSLDVMPDGAVSVCKEKPPLVSILDPDAMRFLRGPEFRRLAEEARRGCSGCFYGEYREPQYAVRDPAVLMEWTRDWFHTFRHGMRAVGRR